MLLITLAHYSVLCFQTAKITNGCARTKTTSIINRAMATEVLCHVMKLVQNQPFTLCTDGNNDQEEEKLIPLTIHIFDLTPGRVVSKFLHTCLSTLGTAAAYFEKMKEVFVAKLIPWQNCIALPVDSCSVNIGKHNSIRKRLEARYPSLFTTCYFIHNVNHSLKCRHSPLGYASHTKSLSLSHV